MSCVPPLGLTHDHMSSVWRANLQIWLCSHSCVFLQRPSSWTLNITHFKCNKNFHHIILVIMASITWFRQRFVTFEVITYLNVPDLQIWLCSHFCVFFQRPSSWTLNIAHFKCNKNFLHIILVIMASITWFRQRFVTFEVITYLNLPGYYAMLFCKLLLTFCWYYI